MLCHYNPLSTNVYKDLKQQTRIWNKTYYPQKNKVYKEKVTRY